MRIDCSTIFHTGSAEFVLPKHRQKQQLQEARSKFDTEQAAFAAERDAILLTRDEIMRIKQDNDESVQKVSPVLG